MSKRRWSSGFSLFKHTGENQPKRPLLHGIKVMLGLAIIVTLSLNLLSKVTNNTNPQDNIDNSSNSNIYSNARNNVLGVSDTKITTGKVKGLIDDIANSNLIIRIPTIYKSLVEATQLRVLEDLNIEQDLIVAGDSTFTANGIFGSNLSISNNLNVGGNLDVEGITTTSITADNVIYSLSAGDGITVSDSQTPVITNDDAGSAQSIFKKIKTGDDTIEADGNNDTLEFIAGSGISLSANTDDDQITITSSSTIWTTSGTNVYLSTTTNNVGIGTISPSSRLHVVGSTDLEGNVELGGSSSDTITFTGRIANGTSLLPDTNLGSDLGSPTNKFNNIYSANLSLDSGISSTGQVLTTYNPADTTFSEATIRVNVTTPADNEQMLGIGVAGLERASIDEDGDITIGYSGLASVPANDNPLNVYNHGTSLVASVDATGITTFQNSTDSTSGFLIMDADGGTPIFNVDTTNERVGIGTSSPEAALQIGGSTNINSIYNIDTNYAAQFRWHSDSRIALSLNSDVTWSAGSGATGGIRLGSSSTGYSYISANGTNLLLNHSAGNVGIGTTSPTSKLHLTGAVTGKALSIFDETGDQDIFSASASGSTKFVISNSGSVGIGKNTGISAKLHVDLGSAGFAGTLTGTVAQFQNSDAGNSAYVAVMGAYDSNSGIVFTDASGGDLGRIVYNNSSESLALYTNGSEKLHIDSSGNIGIGTTSPTSKLHLTGAVTGKALSIFDETGDQDIFTASASGATKFVISNNGNVGIGTGSPSYPLDVNGGSGVVTRIMRDNATNGSLEFSFPSQAATLNSTQSDLVLKAGNFEGLRIGSGNGSVIVNESGSADSDLRVEGDTNENLFFVDASTDRVGIGTNIPLVELDVRGQANFQPGTLESNSGILGITVPSITGNITGIRMAGNPTGNLDSLVQNLVGESRFIARIGDGGGDASVQFDVNGGQTWSIGLDNSESDVFKISSGNLGTNDYLTINTTGLVGIGTTSPTSKLHLSGAVTGKALSIFDETGDQDIFTASASGSTKFVISNSGYVGIGTNTPTYDLDVVTQNSSIRAYSTIGSSSSTYRAENNSSKTLDIKVDGNSVAGTIFGQTRANLGQVLQNGSDLAIGTFSANDFHLGTNNATRLSILSDGKVGIGDTTPASLFTVGNGDLFQVNSTGSIVAIDNVAHSITDTSGDLVFTSAGTQINFADTNVFNIGGLTGVTYNAISDSGTAIIAATDDDLYIEGILEVDSNINLAASTYLNWGNTDGTSGYGFRDNSGTIQYKASGGSWADVGSGGGGGTTYWQQNAGSLSPFSLTLDTNFGATATTSAKVSIASSLTRGQSALIINQTESQDILTASASGTTQFTVGNTGILSLTNSETIDNTTDGSITFAESGGQSITYDLDATKPTISTSTDTLAVTSALDFDDNSATAFTIGDGTNNYLTFDGTTDVGDTLFDFTSASSGITSGSLLSLAGDTITTGNAINTSVDGLTTGNGFYLESTSTTLTTGNLANLYWNPGSATTATGDLLKLSIGANGNIGNILNIEDNGSSVFSVSQSQITNALPTQFTAAGDVSMAYDLNFTNQTASYIKSNAPLYLIAGEIFENNNLTLQTYGTGDLIADLSGTGSLQVIGTDTSIILNTATSTDTDFWLGIQDDAGGDDDDLFQIGDGNIPGTNPFLTINTSGIVGIGDVDPTNGGLVVAAGVTIGTDSTNNLIDDATNGAGSTTLYIGQNTVDTTAPSDRRLKENISSTNLGLSNILGLEVVDFNYKASFTENSDVLHHGLIAQDVITDYSYAVKERSDGYLMIQYERFIPLLIKGVQEQQLQLDSLGEINIEEKIVNLELKVLELEATVSGALANSILIDLEATASGHISYSDLENYLSNEEFSTFAKLSINVWEFISDVTFSAQATFEKLVTFKDDIDVEKNINLTGVLNLNSDQVGLATIPAEQTEIIVTFDTPYIKPPVITANPEGEISLDNDFNFAITDKTEAMFTIKINQPQLEDVIFNWHAFANNTIDPSPSPTSTPSASITPAPSPTATTSADIQ